MIAIEDKLVSLDVIGEQFVCDLSACKGACCVYGDYGAPLEEAELPILDSIYEQVKPYLPEQGIATIEQEGMHVFVEDTARHATPLRDDGVCAYAFFKNGVALCGIEQAFKDGKIDFPKPISCHLYPIRVNVHKHYEAVNYERWNICKAACDNGKNLKVTVFRFVKDALIRKYGIEFYNALEAYSEHKP